MVWFAHENHFTDRQVEEMRWTHFVRLTLQADDIIAARKEQSDRATRERAAAANNAGRF